ncbi:hypothetical protein HK097_008850 [Rhizophlyctis rosea]|uniref:Uncharacterized protein n=1 Tax=Rhizophlyctis rosea TaxID=64517 RepID=A0AAD5SBD0_9FUNG|nr:hypothetical protein HK097_008850 [Rhizophlyctis rosea]
MSLGLYNLIAAHLCRLKIIKMTDAELKKPAVQGIVYVAMDPITEELHKASKATQDARKLAKLTSGVTNTLPASQRNEGDDVNEDGDPAPVLVKADVKGKGTVYAKATGGIPRSRKVELEQEVVRMGAIDDDGVGPSGHVDVVIAHVDNAGDNYVVINDEELIEEEDQGDDDGVALEEDEEEASDELLQEKED